MIDLRSKLSLQEDDRAVAPVVGFILIFAMLIILLSMYQSMWVPIQNSEVEYDHYQTVKDDMTDLRSAIFEAKTTGETQSTTVKLGTRYPNRLIAINPPPATGRLAAGERRDITITKQGGAEIDISSEFSGISSPDEVYTQLLTYSPDYRELDTGAPIRHEHGVLYMNYAETGQGGGIVVHNADQTLVQTPDGGRNQVTITPIQGNYSEQGVQLVSFEPNPGILQTEEFENVNVTVPTNLDESTWEEILSEELPADKVIVDEAAGELTLILDGTWEVQYAPIGTTGAPSSGERGSSSSEINPASPGDVRLVQAENLHEDDRWDLTFVNDGGTTNITDARVNFYYGSATTLESIIDPQHTRTGLGWNVGDDFNAVDPVVELPGDGQDTTITFGFDDVKNKEWWILSVIYESGEEGTYFISEGGTVLSGGGGGGQTLQAIESQGVTGGTQLNFVIENTGTDQVSITDFSVDASAIANKPTIDNNGDNETSIRSSIEEGWANRQSSYKADGEIYDLVDDSNKGGSYAVLGSTDDNVEVDFREFDQDLGTLDFANSSADADITVSLYLNDGTEQIFYFKQA